MPSSETKSDALDIWDAAVAAVDARKLAKDCVSISRGKLEIAGQCFELSAINRVVVVGAGKASGWMAAGLSNVITNSLNVTGHVNVPDPEVFDGGEVVIFGARPAGENLPTQRSVVGTRRIIRLLESAGTRDLCVCLISGGGSALLEDPVEAIDLNEFRSFIRLACQSGATIHQLNTIRKKLSLVKGGGLAAAFAKCKSVFPMQTLIVSDIIGNPIDLIASGPTVTDLSSAEDAIQVFDKLNSSTSFPPAIREWLAQLTESENNDSDYDERFVNSIIGDNETAVGAAAKRAGELGYKVVVDTFHDEYETSARAASRLLDMARASDGKTCVVSGGEPVVQVKRAGGKGGRNHHLVLSALAKLVDSELAFDDFSLLSGGTDGEDGNVSYPGAIIDHCDVVRVRSQQLESEVNNSLAGFDSHTFLAKIGAALPQQKTRTNVCDLRLVLTHATEQ